MYEIFTALTGSGHAKAPNGRQENHWLEKQSYQELGKQKEKRKGKREKRKKEREREINDQRINTTAIATACAARPSVLSC